MTPRDRVRFAGIRRRDTDKFRISNRVEAGFEPSHMWFRGPDAEDLIEGTLTYHDRHQFEVKLAYNVPPDDHRAKYRVEGFFFIPNSLDVNARSYTKEMFYRDLQGYIRFKTPAITLDKLVDPKNELSPLNRVQAPLERLRAGRIDNGDAQTVIEELKLFACVFRSSLRDGAYQLLSQVMRLDESDRPAAEVLVEQAGHSGNLLLDSVERCLGAYRKLRMEISAGGMPPALMEDFQHIDEYLSIVVEEYLNEVLSGLTHRSFSAVDALANRTMDRVLAEETYRRAHRYPSVLDRETSGSNENYAYRKARLKKYVSSILYLTTTLRQEGRGLFELGYALAAGFAMFVAVLISQWAGMKYRIDSAPFLAVVVLGYMIKDRLKEWARLYLGRKVSIWTADYVVAIRDPLSRARVGTYRQHADFIRESEVPQEVLKVRDRPRVFSTNQEGDSEVVLHYEKEVSLDLTRIYSERPRFHALHDIIRFNVSNFLFRMDEPRTSVLYLDPDTRLQTKLDVPRVYHVNVVLRLISVDHTDKEVSVTQRVRLIMSKEGIKRVVEVDTV